MTVDLGAETKEQFEARMSRSHGHTFGPGGRFIAMRCNCDDRLPCPHWAAIENDSEAMVRHLEMETRIAKEQSK